jgi:hypothetical protein
VVEHVAAALPGGGLHVPRSTVEEVLASFTTDEVRRLVAIAARSAPARWRAPVAEVGDELAPEPLLAGVATASIEELLPPPRWLVAMREGTSDQAPGPIDVLATLLQPQSVWSASESEAARASFRRRASFSSSARSPGSRASFSRSRLAN